MIDPLKNKRYIGYVLAVGAATLWGVSGTFAQFLFQEKGLNPEWLVSVRMTSAGLLLLCWIASRNTQSLWSIWKDSNDRKQLWIFSILGMLAVQYTYFAAIAHSNAATGTVLQYLGPVFIAIYFAVKKMQLPSVLETLAILLAVLGTYLMVTHGNWQELTITKTALFWGVAAAVALAFYTIQPAHLLQKFNSGVVVGWGMFLGGLFFSLVGKPWIVPGIWDIQTWMSTLFIIIFGSLIPFYAYLTAVKWIGAQTSSLLACAEPLSAALFAVIWLNTPFGPMDWLGTLCIILTITLLILFPAKPVLSKNIDPEHI